jgi:hypothetical protein
MARCGAAGAEMCGPRQADGSVLPQPDRLRSAGPAQMIQPPVSTAPSIFQSLPLQSVDEFQPDDAARACAPTGQRQAVEDVRPLSPAEKTKKLKSNVSKAERVREKNRLAQARFRQKQRVRS